MKTYLLNIFSNRLLNDEIDKIIKDNKNITTINYDESDINNVLDECSYFSLMDDEKIVIVKNFKLNASSKPLESYLDNPNPHTILILIVDSIDKRNASYKKIKSKGAVIELTELKPNEVIAHISDYCKKNKIKINDTCINKLLEYNLNDYDLVLNEIDKLLIISNELNEELIETYASKLNEDNIFGLCDAITKKDYPKQKELLDSFILNKLDVIPLVSLLAGQYRIILATKEINKSPEYISNLLDIHPYRVKLAIDKAQLYTKNELENIIISLSDLDYNLKSLNADPYALLKEFLIKIS